MKSESLGSESIDYLIMKKINLTFANLSVVNQPQLKVQAKSVVKSKITPVANPQVIPAVRPQVRKILLKSQ